jgi:hypothetical protein
MNLKETGLEFVDWIHMSQDRDKWQAFVNKIMNLRIQQDAGSSSTS